MVALRTYVFVLWLVDNFKLDENYVMFFFLFFSRSTHFWFLQNILVGVKQLNFKFRDIIIFRGESFLSEKYLILFAFFCVRTVLLTWTIILSCIFPRLNENNFLLNPKIRIFCLDIESSNIFVHITVICKYTISTIIHTRMLLYNPLNRIQNFNMSPFQNDVISSGCLTSSLISQKKWV